MIVSINVSHFVKICHVLTILPQLIYRGVANFGTRCIYCSGYRSVIHHYAVDVSSIIFQESLKRGGGCLHKACS